MSTGPGTLCQVRHARFDVQIYAIFFESPLIVPQNFGFVGDKGKIFLPHARVYTIGSSPFLPSPFTFQGFPPMSDPHVFPKRSGLIFLAVGANVCGS